MDLIKEDKDNKRNNPISMRENVLGNLSLDIICSSKLRTDDVCGQISEHISRQMGAVVDIIGAIKVRYFVSNKLSAKLYSQFFISSNY